MKFNDFQKVYNDYVIVYKKGELLAEGNIKCDNMNKYKEEEIIRIDDIEYGALEIILKD